MILAAHQPNFIPHLPWFDKANKADVFVILIHCQFEKNGWQNRANVWDNWWTMPVVSGKKPICEKKYVNGSKLVTLNEQWIYALFTTLGIDTKKIRYDFPTKKAGTERIIELCQHYDCDKYLTNPEATKKYLDEKALKDAKIELIPHEFPHKVHVFEAFDEWGIEGTQKLLAKERARCRT